MRTQVQDQKEECIMCALSLIETYYRKPATDRILQGDILRDISFKFEWTLINPSQTQAERKYKTIEEYTLQYSIVLSQDCDLDEDFEDRKGDGADGHDAYIPSILICHAFPALELKEGAHLKDFGYNMKYKNKHEFNYIKTNRDPRYHYLPKYKDYEIPHLVLDFKQIYALPRTYLYKIYNDYYLASLNELIREQLCQRFSNYFSRFGLPKIEHEKL
jgi:hypothetical protein